LLLRIAYSASTLARPSKVDNAGLAPMRWLLPRATIGDVSRTVLIVDDHADFRRTLRALLEADGFEVVGEAPDGRSAITETERLRPRLVLLDIQLPDLDGFEVAARLKEGTDPPAIVLTSSRNASSYRRRLAQSALGFIAKSELSGEALAGFFG
jgi:DNA-binding NarL/FixJ family response regulator